MTDWCGDRIRAALRGENPTVMARLPQGFAVIGDVQWLPGYSVLLTDDPTITRLSDLAPDQRLEFLASTERLARAVEEACAEADPQFRRINIEILGNREEYLHCHVWPRYHWEPSHYLNNPVWLYPPERWTHPASQLGAHHDRLRDAITDRLVSG